MYKATEDYYEFDGDFEKYLLDIGVSIQHIKKMKNKIMQPGRYEYYNTISEGNKELVQLEKVIGTNRATVGKSVFENVRKMKRGDREPMRFITCFSFLEQMSFAELMVSYQTCSPVHMTYFKEDDEYYLHNDGNHRTLTAMLLGAPYINAIVDIAECDTEKRGKFFAVKEFYKKYHIYLIKKIGNRFDIIYIDEKNNLYEVIGYTGRMENEDCYDLINKLTEEIESDKAELKKLEKYPKIIRKFILKKDKYYRIRQYIDKTSPRNLWEEILKEIKLYKY